MNSLPKIGETFVGLPQGHRDPLFVVRPSGRKRVKGVMEMKCKQTTDLSNVNKLRQLVKDFQALYF